MSRNWFDAAHINCPVAQEDVPFRVLIGEPPICPRCGIVVKLEITQSLQPESVQTPPQGEGGSGNKEIVKG